MHVRDWELFLRQGDAEIGIAQLSQQMTDHLEAASRTVFLAREYAQKAVIDHQLLPDHFPMIFETVDYGAAVADRDRHITFLYFDETVWNRWFQVSIKRSGETRRIYVVTFHKTEWPKVKSKLRRFEVLRSAKT